MKLQIDTEQHKNYCLKLTRRYCRRYNKFIVSNPRIQADLNGYIDELLKNVIMKVSLFK